MALSFGRPPAAYDQTAQQRLQHALEQEDRRNRKVGADVEITLRERLILLSPDGTRWKITVDNAGTLSATSL